MIVKDSLDACEETDQRQSRSIRTRFTDEVEVERMDCAGHSRVMPGLRGDVFDAEFEQMVDPPGQLGASEISDHRRFFTALAFKRFMP